MAFVADVDPCRIRMDHIQPRSIGVQPQLPLFALLAVHLSARQTFKCRLFPLRFPRHAHTLPALGPGARLGWRSLPKLSNGVEPRLATRLSIAATEVRLKYGHKGSNVETTIFVRRAQSPLQLATE